MLNTTKKKLEEAENNFDYSKYEDYLHGKLTRAELIKETKCEIYTFDLLLQKLKLDSRQAFLQKSTKHNFFDCIDSEEKAYILGFYFADGSINTPQIKFSQTEKNKEILDSIKYNICPNAIIHKGPKKYNKYTGYTSKPIYNISINSKHICEKLTEYGMGRNKTYDGEAKLSIIPDDLMVHFIRGYFDGDGCTTFYSGVDKRGREYENVMWSIISNKREHLEYIQKFLYEKYGIISNILNDGRGHFVIGVNKKIHFIRMREILYENATIFLKRKKEKMFNVVFLKKPLLKKIKRIDPFNNGEIIFSSVTNAAKEMKVSNACIRLWIKKGSVQHGFIWKYSE